MPATSPQDPREVVTPDAFSVAPELLGTPLAKPWRRGVAMGIDLLAIVILGSAGWFFLGAGVALLCFRAALRPPEGAWGKSARKATFGFLGVFALVVTLGGVWLDWASENESPIALEAGSSVVGLGLREFGGFAMEAIALSGADSESDMREAAAKLAQRLHDSDVERDEIMEVLEGLAAETDKPWALDAVRAGLADAGLGPVAAEAPTVDADSLALVYAAALQAEDSVRIAELRGPTGEALTADRLGRQQNRIDRLLTENAKLESDLENEQDRGLIRMLVRVADEIGLGFGWAGLYFTLFVAFWGGRTPGKRLMRIRIVRLDGKSIGLWVAFNRFGGYAASIFTGLLGFFEMFWDRNRQGLHDRIALTVVVRE